MRLVRSYERARTPGGDEQQPHTALTARHPRAAHRAIPSPVHDPPGGQDGQYLTLKGLATDGQHVEDDRPLTLTDENQSAQYDGAP
jgi:hypothetical protein